MQNDAADIRTRLALYRGRNLMITVGEYGYGDGHTITIARGDTVARCSCGWNDNGKPPWQYPHLVAAGAAALERHGVLPTRGGEVAAALLINGWQGTLDELTTAVAGILG